MSPFKGGRRRDTQGTKKKPDWIGKDFYLRRTIVREPIKAADRCRVNGAGPNLPSNKILTKVKVVYDVQQPRRLDYKYVGEDVVVTNRRPFFFLLKNLEHGSRERERS